jgi:hypothetical protein
MAIVVACLKILSWHLSEETEDNHEKLSSLVIMAKI